MSLPLDPGCLAASSISLLVGRQRNEMVEWAVAAKVIDETGRDALVKALYGVIRVVAFEAEGIEAMSETVRRQRQ